jgi:membrane dipeptidase
MRFLAAFYRGSRIMQRFSLLVAASLILGACSPVPPPPPEPPPRSVHDAVLTLDTHSDIPLDYATDAVDPRTGDLQNSLDKMRRGGLDASFFVVYVEQTARTDEGYARAQAEARTKFDAIHRTAEQLYPDQIDIAYRAADVARIAATGKLVAAIGIENGYVLGKDLEMLDQDYALGARYVTLVHDGDNDLARSARPKPELGDAAESETGVTELGAEAIARMNRLGIMVDVSHGAKQTALDAMRLSKAPIIASHSGVAGVARHPRNMDDETLLALRANGGVIQVVAFDAYLKPQPDEEAAALRDLRSEFAVTTRASLLALEPARRADYDARLQDIQRRWPPATVRDLVDHIDHAVKLIGIDHVGISSDFGGGGGITGWSDASETGNVTAELLARGYSEADIRKLWSGNLLRVWTAVEETAEKLRAQPN